MFPDTAERLKAQFTDKYVKVDAARPELARFRDVVGQVKTVNMSGRALVEFLDYHLNIGWFDIDASCLTVVDKPAPVLEKVEPKRAHDKPEGKAAPTSGDKQTKDAAAQSELPGRKLSPLEMARLQGGPKAAAPAAPAGEKKKSSTADILAAARGAAAAPAPKSEPKPATAAVTPAAPKGKPSTADILAAARSGKPAEPPAAAPAPVAQPPAAAPPAPEPAPAAEPAPSAEGAVVRIDKSSLSIDEMIAYCRKVDAR